MAKQTPHATKGYYEQVVVPLENRVRELEAENEKLRQALERIYQAGRGPHVEIAREALS